LEPHLGSPRVSVLSEVDPNNQIASGPHTVAFCGPRARLRCKRDDEAHWRHSAFFHTSALAARDTLSLAHGSDSSARITEYPGGPVLPARVWEAVRPATLRARIDRDTGGIESPFTGPTLPILRCGLSAVVAQSLRQRSTWRRKTRPNCMRLCRVYVCARVGAGWPGYSVKGFSQ